MKDFVNKIKTVDENGNVTIDSSKIVCLLPKDYQGVGRNSTMSLFVETYTGYEGLKPVFKLLESTDSNLPCLEEYYNAFEDPTEYIVAMTFAGSLEVWNTWSESTTVGPYIQRFRTNLESKLRAEAFLTIQNLSRQNSKSALVAARYIADKGWKKSVEDDPLWDKKEQKRKQRSVKQDHRVQVDTDFERLLGGNVVNFK